MTNEVMIVENRSIDMIIAEISNAQKLCQQLMKTKHYQKMGEDGIFAIVQKAKSIGMDPLDALNGGMYFVQGKVEMSGQAMLAVIRSKGHSVTLDPKSTDTCVRMHGKRADNGDTWTVQFSVDDAKKQGICRNQWEKMPKVMCMWRCVSQLSRFLFSDVLKGIYVQGEISESNPFDGPGEINENTGEIIVPEIAKVSQEQAAELIDILEECSPEVQTKFKSFIKTAGAESAFDLPLTSFENLKELAIKRRDEFKKQQEKENENSE